MVSFEQLKFCLFQQQKLYVHEYEIHVYSVYAYQDQNFKTVLKSKYFSHIKSTIIQLGCSCFYISLHVIYIDPEQDLTCGLLLELPWILSPSPALS